MNLSKRKTVKWIEALPANRRRGSYPRCLLLMEGERSVVADRLTRLIQQESAAVPIDACWMPRGLPAQRIDGGWDCSPTREGQLGETEGLLTDEQRGVVTSWWLEVIPNANTPNWDIVSRCQIAGKPGLLLVEAKAHHAELSRRGKSKPRTANGEKNDMRIRAAIAEANRALNCLRSGWKLSCDSRYQLCNRFAWSWKVATMGIPVVLIYLGFLNAGEMTDRSDPFATAESWARAVREQSNHVAPPSVWDNPIDVNGVPMIACIRSAQVDLSPRPFGGDYAND